MQYSVHFEARENGFREVTKKEGFHEENIKMVLRRSFVLFIYYLGWIDGS